MGPAILLLSNVSRQSHRGSEVEVLAHDDGDFVLSVVRGPSQVQCQTDIHTLFLSPVFTLPRYT